MTENEAIKGLKYLIGGKSNQYPPDYDMHIQVAIKALEEIQQYRSIGKVEECRKAAERQNAKKPEFEMNFGDYESRFSCDCGKKIVVRHDRGVMDNNDAPNYCLNCGQKLDWSDNS